MNGIKSRWTIAIATLALVATAFAPTNSNVSHAQGATRTFPETGHTVSGRFLEYWDTHGGLAQQGFPISETMQEVSETDGKTYTVQYFERAVFEAHPENAAPNDVLLSLLGVFMLNQKYPNGTPTATSTSGQLFPETGKHVDEPFLTYWNTHGGLAQQGYPISERFMETSDLDGKTYEVQYFERAVFELHPENAPPYNVLLSQLGTFRYKQKHGQGGTTPTPVTPPPPSEPPTATPTPRPTGPDCSGIPASQNASVSPNCGTPGTRFVITGHGFRVGEKVGRYYTSPTGEVSPGSSQSTADSTGTVIFTFNSTGISGADLGVWAGTFEGVTSHNRAIAYFKVVTESGPAPTPTSGSSAACDTTGTHDGSATPSSVGPGQVVSFVATGFRPGENVSFWFTLPSGDVFGTANPLCCAAGDGSVRLQPSPLPDSFFEFEGKWALTFEGASSHHQSVIYFCVHR